MDRKEFLSQIGLGAAGMVLFGCMSGCKKSGDTPSAPSNVNVVIDLTQTANLALATPGGSLVVSNGAIIVAQTLAGGVYLAVSRSCPHEQQPVHFEPTKDDFFCPSHSSRFTSTGAYVSGPAGSSLTQYKTSINGNILTITS